MVSDIKKKTDREIVDLLLKEDKETWNYILTEIIAPFSRNKKYKEICAKHCISTDSLISRVWIILHNNDYKRLRAFRFASSLKTYLFIIVREAQKYEVEEKIGKIPYILSEKNDFETQTISKDIISDIELKYEMNYANNLLAKLWKENPKQAWVLLLRNSLKLSSKEVSIFMNQSVSNIDQMNSRAKTTMKQLRGMR